MSAKPIILTLERKARLKQYILTCIQDGALSWVDLANPIGAFEKMSSIIYGDIRVVVAELARERGGSLLRNAGNALAGLAEDVVARRSRR